MSSRRTRSQVKTGTGKEMDAAATAGAAATPGGGDIKEIKQFLQRQLPGASSKKIATMARSIATEKKDAAAKKRQQGVFIVVLTGNTNVGLHIQIFKRKMQLCWKMKVARIARMRIMNNRWMRWLKRVKNRNLKAHHQLLSKQHQNRVSRAETSCAQRWTDTHTMRASTTVRPRPRRKRKASETSDKEGGSNEESANIQQPEKKKPRTRQNSKSVHVQLPEVELESSNVAGSREQYEF